MKKNLLFTILILFVFVSCKKSSSEAPANTISATIDGVAESFNTNAGAQLGTSIQLNSSLLITGTNGSATGSDGISITINANSTIVKGNYTNTGNTGFMSILYSNGPFSFTQPNTYVTDVNGVNLSTITITSISNSSVQGTFSGKLVLTNGSTIKTVTDGKFNVNIK